MDQSVCVCKKQEFYYIAASDEPREVMRCNWCGDVLNVAEPEPIGKARITKERNGSTHKQD